MIRMSRVGAEFVNDLEDPDSFVRAVHVTGDLENLGQGTPEDQRYFVTVADERTILHFGSSYGGNALLGKIAHGLRQGAYDGWASKKFLAEQYMLIGIHDKETGEDLPRLRRLPERLGQDQPRHDAGPRRPRRPLPRLLLRRRHRVAVGRRGGRQALRDEPGVRRLRRRQGHQRDHQPDRAALDRRGHRHDLHQRRLQPQDAGGLVGGQDPRAARRHRRLAGLDGRPDRGPQGRPTPPRGRTRTAGSPRPSTTSPTSRRTTTSPRACRSTRSSSAAAPATASR